MRDFKPLLYDNNTTIEDIIVLSEKYSMCIWTEGRIDILKSSKYALIYDEKISSDWVGYRNYESGEEHWNIDDDFIKYLSDKDYLHKLDLERIAKEIGVCS